MWALLLASALSSNELLLLSPPDPVLEARIAGQLAPLGWTVRAEVDEPVPTEQRQAHAQARADGARAALFLAWRPGVVELELYDLTRAEAWPRTLEVPADPSAAREAVALVVQAMVAELEPTPAKPRPIPTATEAPTPTNTWIAGAGWRTSLDGQAEVGRHALWVGLGRSLGGLGILAGIELGLPAARSDPRARVTLTRHAASVEVHGLLGAAPLRYGGVGRVSLSWFRRSTEALEPGVMATPRSERLGAEVGLGGLLRFSPGGEGLGIELELGALASFGAPRLAYQSGPEVLETGRVWAVQPRAALALIWR